jgi:hypothetical protein
MKTDEQLSAMNPNDMSLSERVQAPTPKFFKILRTVGLSIAAVGATLLTAPVAIPVGLVTAAGYLTLAGGVLTAVSQTAVDSPKKKEGKDETP